MPVWTSTGITRGICFEMGLCYPSRNPKGIISAHFKYKLLRFLRRISSKMKRVEFQLLFFLPSLVLLAILAGLQSPPVRSESILLPPCKSCWTPAQWRLPGVGFDLTLDTGFV